MKGTESVGFNKNILWFNFSGHIRKSTIGRPDFANSADLELHATQRPKAAVGGQHKTSQTVVAQLSETQVSCNLNNYFWLQVCLAFVRLALAALGVSLGGLGGKFTEF